MDFRAATLLVIITSNNVLKKVGGSMGFAGRLTLRSFSQTRKAIHEIQFGGIHDEYIYVRYLGNVPCGFQ
jgi:hypothetical protein